MLGHAALGMAVVLAAGGCDRGGSAGVKPASASSVQRAPAVQPAGAEGERTAALGPTEPSPEVDDKTPAAPGSALKVDSYDRLLKRFVKPGGVDYAAWGADDKARAELDAFVDGAAGMSAEAPLSAWLNVYNAIVLQLVLEHYPIDSVKEVPKFFKAFERTVAGEKRSLDEIEHRVIRKRFVDARVHVALNCAAKSCPPLSPEAFRQGKLDAQLDELARAVVNDPAHVRVQGKTLRLSEIFFWFEEDFVRDAGSVVAWLKRYARPELAAKLTKDLRRARISYDWKLNEAT